MYSTFHIILFLQVIQSQHAKCQTAANDSISTTSIPISLTSLPNKVNTSLPTVLTQESVSGNNVSSIDENNNEAIQKDAEMESDDFRTQRKNSRNGRHRQAPFLKRLFNFGSKMVARTMEFFSGQKGEDDFVRESRIESAVGTAREASHENIQSLKDINPVQLLKSKFTVKSNKMKRLREVKDSFRRKELKRRIEFFNDDSSDMVIRSLRNSLQGMINMYEKNTDTLQLVVDYRKDKLKRILEIPFFANIIKSRERNGERDDSLGSTSQQSDPSSGSDNDDSENVSAFNPIGELISRKLMSLIDNL